MHAHARTQKFNENVFFRVIEPSQKMCDAKEKAVLLSVPPFVLHFNVVVLPVEALGPMFRDPHCDDFSRVTDHPVPNFLQVRKSRLVALHQMEAVPSIFTHKVHHEQAEQTACRDKSKDDLKRRHESTRGKFCTRQQVHHPELCRTDQSADALPCVNCPPCVVCSGERVYCIRKSRKRTPPSSCAVTFDVWVLLWFLANSPRRGTSPENVCRIQDKASGRSSALSLSVSERS